MGTGLFSTMISNQLNMKMKFISLLFIACSIQTFSQSIKHINPSTVSKVTGYSHAVEVDLGASKMIIISGQVALNAEGKVVGEDNFEQQAEQVFKNIQAIVEHAGGTMHDLVKTTIYLRDVSNIVTFRQVRNKYINVDNPPASTLVEITDLVRDEFLLEVEATAIIRKH
jgi:2-iminobutanoate/2-iminopropanoate deaminase